MLRTTLDLHSVYHSHPFDLQKEIELRVEKFLQPYLYSKGNSNNHHSIQLEIIVGRGLHSKITIEGQHPIRFYTQQYLQKMGYTVRTNPYNEGVLIFFTD